jgi:hypothetical protein
VWIFEDLENSFKLTNRSLSIINPVRRKETTERSHENAASAIGDSRSQITHLPRVTEEAHVVHEEGHTTTGHGHTALEGVHGFAIPTQLESDCAEQTVLGNDGLFAHVIEKETSGTVGVLRGAGSKSAVAD